MKAIDTWGVDWSGNRGIYATNGDTNIVTLDLITLLDEIGRPARVVVENTFCSYDVEQRPAVIAAYAAAGVELLTISSRRTAQRRKVWAEGDIKPGTRGATATLDASQGDEVDAKIIWRIATETNEHLAAPSTRPAPDQSAARDALMKLRRKKTMKYNRNGNPVAISAKDSYAKAMAKCLPVPPEEHQRYLLGAGAKYRLPMVAAIGVAAEHATSRRGVEKILGTHAMGAPSQFRSDMYFWTWKFITKNDELATLAGFQAARRWLIQQVLSAPMKPHSTEFLR